MSKMTFVDSFALLSCKLFSAYFVKNKFLCTSLTRFRTIHMDIKYEAKSSMEIVSVPPIVSTFRQALHTFDGSDSDNNDFKTNFEKLKSMMDAIKPEDLSFDSKLSCIETWNNRDKAPCTYIEVFKNRNITMSIFVLKPGFKMPLHDHPHMHGLLKVISGAVHIRSFTEYPLKEIKHLVDFKTVAKHEAARLTKGLHKKRRFFAKVAASSTCKANSATCTLTPTVSNYHEIEALTLPAAFFDILSPPYDTLIKDIGPRLCRYYRVANEISMNLVELQEIDVPECFYCDQAPYLGPILSE